MEISEVCQYIFNTETSQQSVVAYKVFPDIEP